MLNPLIRLPMQAAAGLLVATVTPPTIAPALAANSYSVEGIQPATAAHVHAAAAGRIGPIRLELDPPVDGSSQGCVRADRDFLGRRCAVNWAGDELALEISRAFAATVSSSSLKHYDFMPPRLHDKNRHEIALVGRCK